MYRADNTMYLWMTALTGEGLIKCVLDRLQAKVAFCPYLEYDILQDTCMWYSLVHFLSCQLAVLLIAG